MSAIREDREMFLVLVNKVKAEIDKYLMPCQLYKIDVNPESQFPIIVAIYTCTQTHKGYFVCGTTLSLDGLLSASFKTFIKFAVTSLQREIERNVKDDYKYNNTRKFFEVNL